MRLKLTSVPSRYIRKTQVAAYLLRKKSSFARSLTLPRRFHGYRACFVLRVNRPKQKCKLPLNIVFRRSELTVSFDWLRRHPHTQHPSIRASKRPKLLRMRVHWLAAKVVTLVLLGASPAFGFVHHVFPLSYPLQVEGRSCYGSRRVSQLALSGEAVAVAAGEPNDGVWDSECKGNC